MNLHRMKEELSRILEGMSVSEGMGMSELEKVHIITDTIKNIGKIEMQEYSQGGGWNAQGYYDSGNSYANRHYVRGHYSRNDDMLERMESRMHDPNTSQEDRYSLKRAMDMMR